METVKTTITFNMAVESERMLIGQLYEKGKFSTNIKNRLIESYTGEIAKDIQFTGMAKDKLIGCFATLLMEIDSQGIDISKMIVGYCNLFTNNYEPKTQNVGVQQVEKQEEPKDDFNIEEFESCGLELC